MVSMSNDDSEIQVLNGRFGPYIWNGKKKGKGQKNITIKKVFGDKEPKDLSLEECKKAVAGKLYQHYSTTLFWKPLSE
jgi:DNA topoisomerase-1